MYHNICLVSVSLILLKTLLSKEQSDTTLVFFYNKKKHFIDHESGSFGQNVGFYQQSFTKTGSDIMKLLGGLEAIPSSNMHRRLVWDYLSDFVEIETEGEQEVEESLVG